MARKDPALEMVTTASEAEGPVAGPGAEAARTVTRARHSKPHPPGLEGAGLSHRPPAGGGKPGDVTQPSLAPGGRTQPAGCSPAPARALAHWHAPARVLHRFSRTLRLPGVLGQCGAGTWDAVPTLPGVRGRARGALPGLCAYPLLRWGCWQEQVCPSLPRAGGDAVPLAGAACSLPVSSDGAWGSPGLGAASSSARVVLLRLAKRTVCPQRGLGGVQEVWPPLPMSVWPCLWHFCVPPLVPVIPRTSPEPIPARNRAVLDPQPRNHE